MEYKTFDWEVAKEKKTLGKWKWLKENHNRTVSYEEFAAAMKSIRPTRNCPSSMKHEYRSLKEKFGFFR